jgi:hypothetical protein
MERALALDAVELLIGGVFVQGSFGAGIVAVHPGVKAIRGEEHLFAVTDLEFFELQDIDEFSGHTRSSFSI